MVERPFPRGNLRAELLERAEAVLRERGLDALSLRELAREAGVSHGAPRSHFVDRKALLDALAERGFLRLADEIRDAAAEEPDDYPAALRAALRAYVQFAVGDPALLELMVSTKADDSTVAVHQAASHLFATTTGLVRSAVQASAIEAAAIEAGDDVERLTLLFSATAQGIASLVASRRIDTEQGDSLIREAVDRFLTPVPSGRRGVRNRPRPGRSTSRRA